MGVAVNQLGVDVLDHLPQPELAGLADNLGMEDNLHQQVAQFVPEFGWIPLVQRFQNLIALGQQVCPQRGVAKLRRTTPFWRANARCPGAPDGLIGPRDGLAVRISPDPTVAQLLAVWGRPMTSSSANLAGREPARTLEEALEVFSGRDDLSDVDAPVVALDAGMTLGTRPSTLVSFVDSPPRLLREGPVSRQEVEARLPEIQ